MGRRYYRRYRRRKKDSFEGLMALVFLIVIFQIKIKTILFLAAFILIGVVLYRRHKRRLILESGIDIIDRMDGVKFEEVLSVHFQKQGYKTQFTPTTNDYGADLVIEKGGEKIVVQAKRWKQVVGIEAVQQAIGAIKHYNAARGMVITNSTFTQQAKNLARTNHIELWDRKTLINFLRSENGREMAERVYELDTLIENNSLGNQQPEICPACGKVLTLRHGKYGKFWGCSGFPICRYTKESANTRKE